MHEEDDIADFTCTENFLTAEELVSLRKSGDEPVRHAVGEKFSTRTDSQVEKDAVERSLANLRDALDQKRASRVCDLIKAEWNEEHNVSLTTKLKGKYVHHMGRSVDGKVALSPEESMFLLENGAIEIVNGAAPMSTEEGFAVMLKGKLAVEKYKVYSHLSQLGFIVVSHQKELSASKHEMTMNLDKHQVKKRKGSPSECQNNLKKRLTFSGALSCETQPSTSFCEVQEQKAEVAEVLEVTEQPGPSVKNIRAAGDSKIQGAASGVDQDSVDNVTQDSDAVAHTQKADGDGSSILEFDADARIGEAVANASTQEENSEGASIHEETAAGASFHEETAAGASTEGSDAGTQLEDVEMKESESDRSAAEETDGQNTDHPPLTTTAIDISRNKETGEPDSGDASGEQVASVNEVGSSETNSQSKGNDKLEIELHIDFFIPDSYKPCKLTTAVQLQNNEQPMTEVSCENIDVMEVDSQNTVCEQSRNGPDETRDSSCVVVDSSGNINVDENSQGSSVMSCSSSHESEGLSLNADSEDSLLSHHEDDDVTLIEVTKKETKPLAVIDLLSGDEENPDAEETDTSDDECSIVKVLLVPSGSKETRNPNPNCFKKEEKGGNLKIRPPTPTVHFPPLFKKDVVSVSRPSPHLLPDHVAPAKEAYILDFRNNQRQPPERRVWDSYKTMQDYQHSRRMNNNTFQTFNEFQNRHMQGRQHRVARPYPDPTRPPWQDNDNRMAGDHPYGHRSLSPFPDSHPTDPLLGFLRKPPRDPPSFPPPPPNCNLPPNFNNLPLNLNLPNSFTNIATMPPAQIMNEVQRTAYSMARSMLSYMMRPPRHDPFAPHFPPAFRNNGDFPPAFCNDVPRFPPPDRPRRQHAGRPFPCHFRRVGGGKRSWGEVREAARGRNEEEDAGEVVEVEPSPRDVLWGQGGMNPLVQAGVRHRKTDVLNSLQKTQMANLSKCRINDRCFEETGALEVAFDVYLPGSNYRKTCPTVPKHRIIVVRSTDPIPRFAELAYLQRKWSDGSSLQIAFVDFGEVSFVSYNSVSLPSLVPHE